MLKHSEYCFLLRLRLCLSYNSLQVTTEGRGCC